MGFLANFKSRPTLDQMAGRYVNSGTDVDIVEYDLVQFRPDAISDWEGMVTRWLDKGAHVGIYCQTVHPGAVGVLNNMTARYPHLAILDYSAVPKDKIPFTKPEHSLDTMKTFHFALFNNPRLMWLEGNHPIGSDVMNDCEWVPETMIDTRYYALANIAHALKEDSRPFDFSKSKVA